MLDVVIGCLLTFILSAISSYFINVYMNGKSKKREVAYEQLVKYSNSLTRLLIKWQEFTELLKRDCDNDGMQNALKLIAVKKKIEEIEKSYSEYRELIHQTGEVIDELFHDRETFINSTYSMNKTPNDEFNEADFLQRTMTNFLMHKVEDNYKDINRGYARSTMNNIYGTYVQIHQYRIRVKMSVAQNYIDNKLRNLLNSMSSVKMKQINSL